MYKRKPKVNEDQTYQQVPKQCGRCSNLTVIFIRESNISRCAECYQREVDNSGRSASNFVFEKGMSKVMP